MHRCGFVLSYVIISRNVAFQFDGRPETKKRVTLEAPPIIIKKATIIITGALLFSSRLFSHRLSFLLSLSTNNDYPPTIFVNG
jgi:hypothetical protein